MPCVLFSISITAPIGRSPDIIMITIGGASAARRTTLAIDRYRYLAVVLPLLPSPPPCRYHTAVGRNRV